NVHWHDDMEMTGPRDRLEQPRAGGARDLERDLTAAHGLQGVAQVAHVEGDLGLLALDAAVELAGVVAHLRAACEHVYATWHELLARGDDVHPHDVRVVAAEDRGGLGRLEEV